MRVARIPSLTPLDLAMLEDLYALGAATTPVVLLLRRSHTVDAGGALTNHRRRLASLHRDGMLSRFADRFGMVVGSRSYIYAVESGQAALAAATRRHYDDIPDETWRDIRKRACATRDRLTECFVLRGHDPVAVRGRLDQLSTLCLRYYAGETTFRHKLLASTAAAILWLGLRAQGTSIHTVLPDGALALTAEGAGIIKPDLFFGAGDTAVFLEAETGTASRQKVAAKLAQYAILAERGLAAAASDATGVRFTRSRVLVHCGTDTHAQLVADAASRSSPPLARDLRITGPADLTIDAAGDELLAVNDIVRNVRLASAEPVLAHFASRATAAIFAAVDGRDASGPVLRCTTFLEEPA